MIKLVFLGTGSMIPTAQRNHSGIFLTYRDEGILVDCGEGIQRQFRKAKISPTKITKLLITHWHGDHILGIPGLLQTLAASKYNRTLEIYGPKGTKEYISKMLDFFVFVKKNENFKFKVKEISEGIFFENEYFILKSSKLKHSITSLGYSLIEKDQLKIIKSFLKKLDISPCPMLKKLKEGKNIKLKGRTIKAKDATLLKKGKKITFISDTGKCQSAVDLAKDSDLLISEATFDDALIEKADSYDHMTASQAAELAKNSSSKKLILTHFSQRYKSVKKLKIQAKKTFPNTETAKEFMVLSL
ncbi:MAG: ribonuclease Z [Nanoarchaeota archaeon]|nr:ribonuclease Z [Nanoarchaeota archaeon]